jgi:hypothetical protein
MSEIRIRLQDVYGKPLDDTVDLVVVAHRTGRAAARVTGKPGTRVIRVPDLAPGEVYLVKVFPSRHRAVVHFVHTGAGARTELELVCPADPDRVHSIVAPPYAALSARARVLLEASVLEHPPRDTSGEALYGSPQLSDVQKAGLLNLLAKMAHTPLPDGSTVLDHVESLYRIRGDRVFANVALALRDLMRTGVDAQLFRLVSGSLHKPDPAFRLVDSYKTPESYGNLQVTFFASVAPPLRFTADIDIDDAQGIGHIFQVIGHHVTGAQTSPYDIHEILVRHQFLDPGYQLVLA